MYRVLAAIIFGASALLAACGGGGGTATPTTSPGIATPSASATIPVASPTAAANTSTPTEAPAPAAAATVPPAAAATVAPPSAAATDTPAPPAPPPPPTGGGSVTISGLDLKFDPAGPSLVAGSVTVIFNNIDSGVAHNIHFYNRNADLASTAIVVGNAQQTLSLGILAPGSYRFACDVHPTMRGVLTVS